MNNINSNDLKNKKIQNIIKDRIVPLFINMKWKH